MNDKEEIILTEIDPLKDSYHESFIDHPAHAKLLQTKHTALLVIDVQYLDAAEGYGVFADVINSGVPPEAQEYYFTNLKNIVIPNIQKLQATFRKYGLEVIHTRIQSLTKDGRDRSPGHKRLGLHAPPGSKEAEFIPEIAPKGDEIVINKTASGVFTSTNLLYILRNMDISGLFVTGVYTNECVSTTVRDGCDLGFFVTVIEDGCTTVTQHLHDSTLDTLRDRYCRVIKTEEAIKEIEQMVADKIRKN
ncbi:MAG: cysteine hydrolase [Leptospiraceae bacterium]|nr:cysteine hydrolase [Leptospiraceae bacterium]